MKKHQITLSQALEGYMLYAEARRLSPHTLSDYATTFIKFQNFLADDPPLIEIEAHRVQEFLAAQTHLKKKTLLNYRTGLSALWSWAVSEGLIHENIVHKTPAPKPEQTVINPFTEQDVKLMLAACDRSRSYYVHPSQQEKCSRALPHPERNKAIILTFLDTGIRNSELRNTVIADVDLKNKQMVVTGKGSKQRIVQLSSKTARGIWHYLAIRPEALDDDPLFASNYEQNFTRQGLSRLIKNIGQRANVPDAHPHRFRHTFAITFLRNGGNMFVLQQLLGHSTLDMVKHYLMLASQDCGAAHRRASPVANWSL
jgi:site-specific recombinase XerD